MRVLLNALQAGNRSGTGRYTAELAKRLPGLVSDVEVNVLWPSHVAAPVEEPLSAAFIPIDVASPYRRIVQDQWAIRGVRKRLGADIVHYPANVGPQFSFMPYVLTIHDLSFYRHATWYRLSRAVYYWLAVRRSAMSARRILADSRTTATDIMEMLNIPARKIDVAPLGVGEEFAPATPEAQAAARAKYALPETFFLYVGTLEPRKNIPRIIQAWDAIAPACACELVIAGRDGWKTGPMRAAAKRVKMPGRLHFPGFIEQADLPAVLSAARAFVWPSLCEGFGLPPLEAMACGTPAISSNLSCMPEVLGDAAVLVDPYVPEELSDAMRILATSEPQHERMRQKGMARAKRFTWQHTADVAAASYRKAVSK